MIHGTRVPARPLLHVEPKPDDGFRRIGNAQCIPEGTVADLKMANGEIVRAVFCQRGRATAWYIENSPMGSSPIGLYEPVEFRVLKTAPEPVITINGVTLTSDQAAAVRHASGNWMNELCRPEVEKSLGKNMTDRHLDALEAVNALIYPMKV